MGDARYIDKAKWNELERQYVFEALMPYVPERPIDFFVPDPTDPNKGTISHSLGDFSGVSEQKVVLTLKRRKVVVLTSTDLARDTDLPDITVAKIVSIKPLETQTPWYNLLVADKHPLFAYLPKSVTGTESYVDLSAVTTIGKTMLLSKKMMVPDNRMDVIVTVLKDCIELGVVQTSETEITGS